MSAGFTLFETALGRCGIAWCERGVMAVQLPESDDDVTRERLLKFAGPVDRAAPPAWVGDAIRRLQRHLAGEVQDLAGIRLDLEYATPFLRKVYEESRKVASGTTISYGELAARAGSPGAARAVGQAMARNRIPVVIPCHRVLASGQAPGGFSAAGGLDTKRRLLALEGVRLREQRNLLRNRAVPPDFARAVRALAAADEKLARIIERVGPYRPQLEATESPFEALAEAIIYQQLAGKAAAAILARTWALFGPDRGPTPQEIVDSTEEQLRAAGLSGPKIKALKDLAARALDGVVPSMDEMATMDDEAIVERLTAVRGVGRWTAEMLLLRLGRRDVLPASDYGVRKGFALMMGRKELPTPEAVLRRGERWRPNRSVAAWYLWRALEL